MQCKSCLIIQRIGSSRRLFIQDTSVCVCVWLAYTPKMAIYFDSLEWENMMRNHNVFQTTKLPYSDQKGLLNPQIWDVFCCYLPLLPNKVKQRKSTMRTCPAHLRQEALPPAMPCSLKIWLPWRCHPPNRLIADGWKWKGKFPAGELPSKWGKKKRSKRQPGRQNLILAMAGNPSSLNFKPISSVPPMRVILPAINKFYDFVGTVPQSYPLKIWTKNINARPSIHQ